MFFSITIRSIFVPLYGRVPFLRPPTKLCVGTDPVHQQKRDTIVPIRPSRSSDESLHITPTCPGGGDDPLTRPCCLPYGETIFRDPLGTVSLWIGFIGSRGPRLCGDVCFLSMDKPHIQRNATHCSFSRFCPCPCCDQEPLAIRYNINPPVYYHLLEARICSSR